jgi:uncharacterized membrane protein
VLATPAPASSAAALSPSRGGRSIALVTVAVVAVIGGLVVAYAASNYDRLPERVPSHFGSSGGADAWSRKSPASVMVLPVGTLVLGALLAGVALLTASAKRAVRIHDPGTSVEAQNRFRSAMSLFLSGTALSATSLLAALSVSAIRIGIGDSTTISPLVPVLTVLMLVYAIGGSLFLSLRMGQGGSRLERAAGGNPLTDGLADNQRWKWGLFYVNPEDPSIFVEKRFGLGYTINFGNRRAVLLFLGFMVAVGLFVLVASLTAGD